LIGKIVNSNLWLSDAAENDALEFISVKIHSLTFLPRKLKSPRCWAGAFHPSVVIGWNLDGRARVETEAHCVYHGYYLRMVNPTILLNYHALSGLFTRFCVHNFQGVETFLQVADPSVRSRHIEVLVDYPTGIVQHIDVQFT